MTNDPDMTPALRLTDENERKKPKWCFDTEAGGLFCSNAGGMYTEAAAALTSYEETLCYVVGTGMWQELPACCIDCLERKWKKWEKNLILFQSTEACESGSEKSRVSFKLLRFKPRSELRRTSTYSQGFMTQPTIYSCLLIKPMSHKAQNIN